MLFCCCCVYCVVIQFDRSKHDPWLKDVYLGLADIFSSRLDSRRRELALRLSAILSQIFGLDWAVQSEPRFLLLWLHLVVVVSLL